MEGYDVDEVDDFLEGLKTQNPATVSGPTPTLPTSTGGLRGWLFGRR